MLHGSVVASFCSAAALLCHSAVLCHLDLHCKPKPGDGLDKHRPACDPPHAPLRERDYWKRTRVPTNPTSKPTNQPIACATSFVSPPPLPESLAPKSLAPESLAPESLVPRLNLGLVVGHVRTPHHAPTALAPIAMPSNHWYSTRHC